MALRLRRREKDGEIVSITSAPTSPAAELADRQRRYLIAMGLRTACFLGAVLSLKVLWLAGLFLVASLILPSLAVVLANSADPRPADRPAEVPRTEPRELGR